MIFWQCFGSGRTSKKRRQTARNGSRDSPPNTLPKIIILSGHDPKYQNNNFNYLYLQVCKISIRNKCTRKQKGSISISYVLRNTGSVGLLNYDAISFC